MSDKRQLVPIEKRFTYNLKRLLILQFLVEICNYRERGGWQHVELRGVERERARRGWVGQAREVEGSLGILNRVGVLMSYSNGSYRSYSNLSNLNLL